MRFTETFNAICSNNWDVDLIKFCCQLTALVIDVSDKQTDPNGKYKTAILNGKAI